MWQLIGGNHTTMVDSAFVQRSQIQEQEESKYILLPAKFQISRYSIRTKPCKYFELGCCRYGKKCRFFHDPRGPRRFVSEEEISKKILIELDKKFEEIQTNMKRIINNLTAEITNLKSLLMKRLDNISGIDEHQTAKQTHPPPTVLHKTLSENKNTLTNLAELIKTKPASNNSDPKTNQVEISNDKTCEHCGSSANLRCSKCQSIYYCTREHQLAHWKSHKKFCALISEDPRAKVKEFGTVLDTESEVLDLKITKTKKSLGIVLQMDEQEKVVFINDIVNSDISILKAGDQILRINNKKIDSVQGITQIVSQVDIGNDIEFKIKRPKKEVMK